MFSVNLSAHACDGRVVVALRGELDVTDAASVAAALTPVAAREREIVIDLAGLEFIDSSGLAALVLVRKHARHAGGDLILAGPQREVLRVLTITRLLDVFSVHTCADSVEGPQEAVPAAPSPALLTTAG